MARKSEKKCHVQTCLPPLPSLKRSSHLSPHCSLPPPSSSRSAHCIAHHIMHGCSYCTVTPFRRLATQ